jgi:uncharacterized protein YkwD
LALLVLLVAIAAEGRAAADPPTCATGAAERAAIVCEINAARAEAGRAPLHSRPSLVEAGRAHASDMVERRYFAHESPEGEGRADRARRRRKHAHEMWLESPSHRRILLSPRYRDVGAGPVDGARVGDPDDHGHGGLRTPEVAPLLAVA